MNTDNKPHDRLLQFIKQQLEAEQRDINMPYALPDFWRDLNSVYAPTTKKRPAPRVEILEADTGHRHILSANADHLYLRIAHCLMDIYGERIGGSHYLRTVAVIQFWNINQNRMIQTGLQWTTPEGHTRINFDFIDYLLRWPVEPKDQWKPDAISSAAIDGFLSARLPPRWEKLLEKAT